MITWKHGDFPNDVADSTIICYHGYYSRSFYLKENDSGFQYSKIVYKETTQTFNPIRIFNEEYFKDFIQEIKDFIKYNKIHNQIIAFPYEIGNEFGFYADWVTVYNIIKNELKDFNVEIWRRDED